MQLLGGRIIQLAIRPQLEKIFAKIGRSVLCEDRPILTKRQDRA